MILRELSTEEIRSLSCRCGVEQIAVEKFLMSIGGVPLESAYKKLKRERKLHRWNLRTIGVMSDGIILATTNYK